MAAISGASDSWRHHPADRLLVPVFLAFFLTSVLFDRAAGLDLVAPDSPDLFGRLLWSYGARFDPIVADNPLILRIMSAISAFVYGPFYLALVYAIIRRRAWIRPWAFVYAITILYSMIVHVAAEFMYVRPPPNLLVFWATYAPYMAAPALLLLRMAPRTPFATARD